MTARVALTIWAGMAGPSAMTLVVDVPSSTVVTLLDRVSALLWVRCVVL